MTIYLYVKTHQKTGLKYLGKTTMNPDSYLGSGLHWKRHLKIHGKEHITEILRECQTNAEVKEWGIYYSNLWNIVESSEWANLMVESGEGGKQSDSSIAKMIETRKKNGTLGPNKETVKKIVEARKRNGTTGKGEKKSPEHIAKVVATKRANNSYGHKQTPDSIAKMIETKKINGTAVYSRESYIKAWETRRKKQANQSPIS